MKESFNEMDSNLEGDVGHCAGGVTDSSRLLSSCLFFFFSCIFTHSDVLLILLLPSFLKVSTVTIKKTK